MTNVEKGPAEPSVNKCVLLSLLTLDPFVALGLNESRRLNAHGEKPGGAHVHFLCFAIFILTTPCFGVGALLQCLGFAITWRLFNVALPLPPRKKACVQSVVAELETRTPASCTPTQPWLPSLSPSFVLFYFIFPWPLFFSLFFFFSTLTGCAHVSRFPQSPPPLSIIIALQSMRALVSVRCRSINSFLLASTARRDSQEGVGAEAAAFSAHEQLDNLIILYDSNDVTLDKMAEFTMSEDTAQRYVSYGWDVVTVDGHDLSAVSQVCFSARFLPLCMTDFYFLLFFFFAVDGNVLVFVHACFARVVLANRRARMSGWKLDNRRFRPAGVVLWYFLGACPIFVPQVGLFSSIFVAVCSLRLPPHSTREQA